MAGTDKDILAKVESELKLFKFQHMDEAGVPQELQLTVYKRGYDSTRIWLHAHILRISMIARRQCARPICRWITRLALKSNAAWPCWSAYGMLADCNLRSKKSTNQRLSCRPTPKESEVPSKSLVAQKLGQVEDNCPGPPWQTPPRKLTRRWSTPLARFCVSSQGKQRPHPRARQRSCGWDIAD